MSNYNIAEFMINLAKALEYLWSHNNKPKGGLKR